METATTLTALAHFNQSLIMNCLYWMAVMCVVFKLTWIIRQVGSLKPWRRWPIALSAGALSFVLLTKAYIRFNGGDAAQLIDIARELSLCVFLISIIVLIKGQTERY